MIYASNGQHAFELIELDELVNDPEGCGLDADFDPYHYSTEPGAYVFAILAPTDGGGWSYDGFLSGDELESELTAAGHIGGEESPARGDKAAPLVQGLDRCTCGLEIARASSRCTERDCPYK